MIFKILLPALVALVVYFLGRSHARQGNAIAQRRPNLGPSPAPISRTFQLIAISLVISVVSLASWYIYRDWKESQKTVQIRIVNTQTGKTAVYQALRHKVHGRMFQTTDGRRITLADVERMEMVGLP